jgi:hypothetical protein
MKEANIRLLRQRLRDAGGLWLLVLLATAVLGTSWLVRRADRELRTSLLERTTLVAKAVDVTRIQGLTGTAADLNRPDYQRLQEQLTDVLQANNKTKSVYLVGRSKQRKVFFHLDVQDEGLALPPAPPGETYDDASPELVGIFDTRTPFVEGPLPDEWGVWVSAIVPVVDTQANRTIAALGVDIDARTWKWD